MFVTFKSALKLLTYRTVTKLEKIVCVHRRSHWHIADSYMDPVDELQSLVQVPLFSSAERVFIPSLTGMREADAMFKGSLGKQSISTIKGVINVDGLPTVEIPEVCFVGQSNVGKSSLIKSLFYNPPNVKISISKTPGHTKTIQFYSLAKLFTLVDMPGYGYNMPVHYTESVEQYLQNRKRLVRIFLLLDAEDGITDVDRIGIRMLEEFGKPYTIVLTKIDKTTPHKVLRTIFRIKEERDSLMPMVLPQPFLVSSLRDYGLVLLRTFIYHVTGNDGG